MSRPVDERLSELRATGQARLVQGLLDGNVALTELRELQERLKLIDAAQEGLRARRQRRVLTSLAPVAVVALALLVAVAVPVRSVPFALELQATAVGMELGQGSVLDAQALQGELRVDGFSAVESPDAVLGKMSIGEGAIAMRATELTLRDVALPAGSSLQMDAGGGGSSRILIESPRAPLGADVELRGLATIRQNDAGAPVVRNFEHSEWLRLVSAAAAAQAKGAARMVFWLAPPEGTPQRFLGLRPTQLRFAQRAGGTGATGVVSSSLVSGSVSLPATERSVTLSTGESLQIDGLQAAHCEVLLGSNIRIKLSGSAREMLLRVGEYERSLKPSLLEYLSKNHLVTLLWSSAAVLWGALAWARKYFAEGLS